MLCQHWTHYNGNKNTPLAASSKRFLAVLLGLSAWQKESKKGEKTSLEAPLQEESNRSAHRGVAKEETPALAFFKL